MSKRSRETESKSYNPKDDPYFPVQARVIGGGGMDSYGLAIVAVVVGGGVAAVRKLGWIGLAGIVLVAVLVAAVWLLIRRSLIKSAAERGYINRHNMTTRECITPREKRLMQRFYTMDCGYCGKSNNVQAINLRRKKCPHCGSKKVNY